MVHIVDCVIEDPVKLILEADGRTYHERLDDMERDRKRDRRASKLGYPTFRYLYGELTQNRQAVRDEILDFIATASARAAADAAAAGPQSEAVRNPR